MKKKITDPRIKALNIYIKRDNLRVETIARGVGVTARTIYNWTDGLASVSPLASAPLDTFLANLEKEISEERDR